MRVAAKQVRESDVVQLGERTFECQDFHEAVLQCQGVSTSADTHQRAGCVPGDLKFAQ